jgi:hypothetical protein
MRSVCPLYFSPIYREFYSIPAAAGRGAGHITRYRQRVRSPNPSSSPVPAAAAIAAASSPRSHGFGEGCRLGLSPAPLSARCLGLPVPRLTPSPHSPRHHGILRLLRRRRSSGGMLRLLRRRRSSGRGIRRPLRRRGRAPRSLRRSWI